jgi:hypothetical protein
MESVNPIGVPLYMRHGFIPYYEHRVEPKMQNPDKEWKDMEKKMQPLLFLPMWRPVYGKFVPGKTILPWNDDKLIGSGTLSKL